MTGLIVPALCVATIGVILIVDYRRYKREEKARAQFRDEMRQERAAQRAAHPQTGQVAPSPRLAPLADIVPLRDVAPNRDWDSAA